MPNDGVTSAPDAVVGTDTIGSFGCCRAGQYYLARRYEAARVLFQRLAFCEQQGHGLGGIRYAAAPDRHQAVNLRRAGIARDAGGDAH